MALKSVANRAQKRGKVYYDFVKYSPLPAEGLTCANPGAKTPIGVIGNFLTCRCNIPGMIPGLTMMSPFNQKAMKGLYIIYIII